MINKTNVLLQTEEIIKPLALEHVPQDSDVEAVIDQWLHAIATWVGFERGDRIR